MLRPARPSIRRELRRIWQETGCVEAYQPASHFLDVVRSYRTVNRPHCDVSVLNWILVLEEISLWASCVFASTIRSERTDETPFQVKKLVLGGLCAKLNGLLALVQSGFDVSAKMVLRQLLEYRDLLHSLMGDDDLCEEFFAAHLPEESNRFWHRRISKGKGRANARKSLQTKYPQIIFWFDELQDYQGEEDIVLSAASHPSYLASGFAACGSPGGPLTVFGYPSNASVRTLRLSFVAMFELMQLRREELQQIVECYNDPGSPVWKLADERTEFCYKVLDYVGRNQGADDFLAQEEDEGEEASIR